MYWIKVKKALLLLFTGNFICFKATKFLWVDWIPLLKSKSPNAAITQFQKQPPEVLYKKTVLKISQYSQETPVLESLFIKVAGLGLQLYQKDAQTQVLSSEYCEIFKNTHFEKHLQKTAPVILLSLRVWQVKLVSRNH